MASSTMKLGMALVSVAGLTAAAQAQVQVPPAYNQPAWGQQGISTWGTYSGAIGQGGWHYNQQLRPNEPAGTVLVDPNQLNSSFANPHTGANLFQPQDTRFRGRDRP
jgi:hypothetical protein